MVCEEVAAREVGMAEVVKVKDSVEDNDREGEKVACLVVAKALGVNVSLTECVDTQVVARGEVDTVSVLNKVLTLVKGGEKETLRDPEEDRDREGDEVREAEGVKVPAREVGMGEVLKVWATE